MKRVCVFCETWSSGGIESFLCKLLSRMDKTDLQIDLVVSCRKDSVFTGALEECEINIMELSGSKFRWVSNCVLFQKLLREKRYDVLHLNVFQGLQLVYLRLAEKAGVPVRIAHSHGSDLRKSGLRRWKLSMHEFGKKCFKKSATACWTCSSRAAEFMFGTETVRFVPNGIDTCRYRFDPEIRKQIRAELGLEGKFVIGSVGRLQYDKNQMFLLDVLAELISDKPESRLLLVGDGTARQELQTRVKELGLEEQVCFYGVSDRVEQLLWAMDAFAFPSLSEGLGLVAVEAQAAGLPVIGSEFIPEEAALTPLFRRVPLTEGERAWGQALLQAECGVREDAAEAVSQAGFEISGVAEAIRKEYLCEGKRI